MNNSFVQWLIPVRDSHPLRAAHWINAHRHGHLLLVETAHMESDVITEVITGLALRGPFNLIAGDEWLPDRDTLYRSIRRYSLSVEETLDHPNLMRPMTCLQMLDLLMEADLRNRPTLILNFLHHFYNADVERSLRDRTLEQCCQCIKRLALSSSVVILVPHLSTTEYRRFFPWLASMADEFIPVKRDSPANVIQDLLL